MGVFKDSVLLAIFVVELNNIYTPHQVPHLLSFENQSLMLIKLI
tara:strand:- start:83 stop:214 length:132 start_codon:yes stop_codon:yes gene_type:complete